MTVKTLSRKHELKRSVDLNNLFAQVESPYGSLHLFGARPVHLSHLYEQELVGKQVPDTWRRGKLASKSS